MSEISSRQQRGVIVGKTDRFAPAAGSSGRDETRPWKKGVSRSSRSKSQIFCIVRTSSRLPRRVTVRGDDHPADIIVAQQRERVDLIRSVVDRGDRASSREPLRCFVST